MKSTYSAIIADDHPLFRIGITSILKNNHNLQIVFEASEGTEALEKTLELKPDILITDISMPGISGIEILKRLAAENSPTNVIILSMHNEDEYILNCMELGAKAYLLKDSVTDDLLVAVNKIMGGEYFFCSCTSKLIVKNVLARKEFVSPEVIRDISLTAREREILVLLSKGISKKKIADQLFISVRTVDAHKYNIMQKLNVSSTSELLYFALKNHIIN